MTCRGLVTLHPSLGTASQNGPSWVSARAPQGWSVISQGSPGARQWAERDWGLPARTPGAKASREVDTHSPAAWGPSPHRALATQPFHGALTGPAWHCCLFPVQMLRLPNYAGSSQRAVGPITACPLDPVAELTTEAWPWGDALNRDARVLFSGPLTGPPSDFPPALSVLGRISRRQ